MYKFYKRHIKSKSKNTAIENKKLQGKVEKTFLNGNLVFDKNELFNSFNIILFYWQYSIWIINYKTF